MIKIEITVFLFLLVTNILVHFMFEKQEKKIEKIIMDNEKLDEEIQLLKVNLSFLKRQENLKRINTKNFNLKPYDILDIIYYHKGTKSE